MFPKSFNDDISCNCQRRCNVLLTTVVWGWRTKRNLEIVFFVTVATRNAEYDLNQVTALPWLMEWTKWTKDRLSNLFMETILLDAEQITEERKFYQKQNFIVRRVVCAVYKFSAVRTIIKASKIWDEEFFDHLVIQTVKFVDDQSHNGHWLTVFSTLYDMACQVAEHHLPGLQVLLDLKWKRVILQQHVWWLQPKRYSKVL